MIQTQRTVLVVDDSPEDCELYRRYLQRDQDYHYTFLTAHLGEEGLDLWQRHHPDVMLLDYQLPDLDGLELLAALQAETRQPYLPVIVVTGQGNEAIAVQAMKVGAQDYLVKEQITPEGLRLAVNEVIEKVQLRTELHQRIERERLVAQITQHIHGSLELDKILQTTVDEVRQFLRTDRVFIFRLEGDSRGTVVTESVGAEWSSILASQICDPCFVESCIESYRQGCVTVETNFEDNTFEHGYVELLTQFQVKANLVVPILQEDQLWGMLIAHNCVSSRQWQPLEVDLLKELAAQVGIALHQAELYQQVQRELIERQQAEAALKESEARFRQLTENIDAVFWIADFPSRQVLYISSAYERLWNLTSQDVYDDCQSWTDLIHPDDRAMTDQAFQEQAVAGKFDQEYRILLPDGQVRWVHDRCSPLKDQVGDVYRFTGLAEDITDRKRRELNEQFLNQLDLRLRILSDTQAMVEETVNCLGQYLEGNQCTLSKVDLQRDLYVAEQNWCRDVPSIAGMCFSVSKFATPEFQAAFASGQLAVVQDVTTDLRTAAFAENYERIGSRSFVAVPCLYQWQWSAVLTLSSKTPRVWRDDEVELLQETVARVWSQMEQTQALQALRESEERFQMALEGSDGGLWTWDLSTNEEYWNTRWLEILGYEKGELPQCFSTWERLIHPDDKGLVMDLLHTHLQDDSVPYRFECRMLAKSGEWKWIANYGKVVVRDEQGHPLRMAGIHHDVSDRKQVECEQERLLLREQQYAGKLRRLTQAALLINAASTLDDILKLVTDQASHIVGCHQAVASLSIDQNWSQSIKAVYLSDKYAHWQADDEKPDGSKIYAAVCALNRPIRMTQAQLEVNPRWQIFAKGVGKHPPLRGWLAVPLTTCDGHNLGLIQLSDKHEGEFSEEDEAFLIQLAQLASVAIENTRLYEAEQEARAAAERANRIKDEFLAVLSHELRSPLNPILGWATLLQTRKMDEAKTAEGLAIIARNVKLQTQLIDDLLDVAKILRGKLSLAMAPVNLVSVIEFAIDIVRTAAAAKSILIHSTLPNVGQVSGDSARLQQIVWNLLANAIKFTLPGGSINIRLEQFGNQAQVTVSDTGKGIAPDFLPHIFESFRQEDVSTTRKYGGLGLGLAIVRQLVEAHGGTISATSPGEGMGATFTVKLPLLLDTALALQPIAAIAEQDPDLSGIRILAVDDDSASRELLTVLLTQYGAEVMPVSCAAEVLVSLEVFHPDLLICDIGMPDVDGYTLIQQIRMLPPEHKGNIPAIALTAYARAEDQQRALESGFQKHIAKPVSANQLAQVVTAAVAGRHPQYLQDLARP